MVTLQPTKTIKCIFLSVLDMILSSVARFVLVRYLVFISTFYLEDNGQVASLLWF